MKVLILSHVFAPTRDGGSRLLFWLGKELSRRGHQVEIWTSDALSSDEFLQSKQPRRPSLQRAGIKIRRFFSWRHWPRWQHLLFGPILPALFLPRGRQFQAVIAGPWPTLMPVYGWWLTRFSRRRLILVPCFHQNEAGFRRSYLFWFLRQADKIVALSQAEKRFYQQLGIEKEKIIVLTANLAKDLMLSPHQPAQFPKPPQALFLGSQAAHKRIEWLFQFFRWLNRHRDDLPPLCQQAQLVIAGQQTLFSPILRKKYYRLPLRIRRRIHFFNHLREEKKKKLLDRAWVLLNPSRAESLSIVAMEALARKKPVVAMDLPPLRGRFSYGLVLTKTRSAFWDIAAHFLSHPGWAKNEGEKGYFSLRKIKLPPDWDWRLLCG